MDFSSLVQYVSIIVVLALLWPRGYLLIYLIDRSKSFRFGFKFFAGWALGVAGFTLDLLGAITLGGQGLVWWVMAYAAFSQVIGFNFVIFLFERRIIYPRWRPLVNGIRLQWERLRQISFLQIALVITIVPLFIFAAFNTSQLSTDQELVDAPAFLIYEAGDLPIGDEALLPGGFASYPLNDSLLKASVATVTGAFSEQLMQVLNIFYLLLLIGSFYFMLPVQLPRSMRLFSIAVLCMVIGSLAIYGIISLDLLYAFFLLLSVAGFFYFVAGAGLSFYYFGLISFALASWSSPAGLLFGFPVIALTTIGIFVFRKVSVKDFFLSWFFALLTIAPWLLVNKLLFEDIYTGLSLIARLFTQEGVITALQATFARPFSIAWLIMLAFILIWTKKLWRLKPLLLLTTLVIVLRLVASAHTAGGYFDRMIDQLNVWFAPLAIFVLTFFFHDLFNRFHWYGKKI